MTIEVEDEEKNIISHFLQLSIQRKVQGLRLKSTNASDNKNNNVNFIPDHRNNNGSISSSLKVTETKRFSDFEKKNLDCDYIKAVDIINELMNDRFDSDSKVRINLIKNLEKIFKTDSIFTCIIIIHLSSLINDNNINVVKAIIDLLYNNIEIIVPNLFLPFSVKYITIEKESSLNYQRNQIDNDSNDEYFKYSWWFSDLSKRLGFTTLESLNSFFSLINMISIIIETYGRGGVKIKYNNILNKDSFQNNEFELNLFEIDDKYKQEQLFKKALKLSFKILRILTMNSDIVKDIKPNLIKDLRNRLDLQFWDYPNNFDFYHKNPNKIIIITHFQQNYTYINQYGSLFPIEIFLFKDNISIFRNVIKNLSLSIENSGRNLFNIQNNYLNICYWIQFIGWLCCSETLYLNRFISIIVEVSMKLTDQNQENNNQEKTNAVKYVFKEELLRILALSKIYENFILLGEITKILNKLSNKNRNFYELRQEAISKYSSLNNNDNSKLNNDINVNSNLTDSKQIKFDESEYPPIQLQKSRSRSTRYSYKRMKYDVENGFYKISPQSVIEGVSWLFSTNSYSNVIDIAIGNFLNLKIPSNLLLNDNDSQIQVNNKSKQNFNLLLNSNKTSWTNKFSPLDNNESLELSLLNNKDQNHISNLKDNDLSKIDEMFIFNYKKKEVKDLLNLNIYEHEREKEILTNSNSKRSLNQFENDNYDLNQGNDQFDEEFLMQGLTNAIQVSDWEELKNNTNSMKSIIFSQIITSVLLTPVVEMTNDGIYKVSRTLFNNNQLMNILKYGQLILTSWELLLKRINESDKETKLNNEIENYNENVKIAWNLFTERVNDAFEILYYKYRLLIRLILNKNITELNQTDLKMQIVFIDILTTNLLSETKELLINILLVTNINDEQNSCEMNEDYYIFLDNILYNNNLDLYNIQGLNENYLNNESNKNGNELNNINVILLLWIYNFVLEQRVKIIHNLLFRFFHLNINFYLNKVDQNKLFEWLIDEESTKLDIISDDNTIIVNYDKLFVFCINNFIKCISEFSFKSELFLVQLKNLILNTPKIPNNFLRILFSEWIFYPGAFESNNSEINMIKRDYAINILYEILNSNYSIENIRKFSYFIMLISFLKNEVNRINGSFLDNVCLFIENGNNDSNKISSSSNESSNMNFFSFIKELFSIENVSHNKKINIQTNYENTCEFIYILISITYGDNVISEDNNNVNISSINEYINEENISNWNNIDIYGEKWLIIISILLISNLIANDIIGNYDKDFGNIFTMNKFISSIVDNTMIMLNNELNRKYNIKMDLKKGLLEFFNESNNKIYKEAKMNEKDIKMDVDEEDINRMQINNLNYIEEIFLNSSIIFKYYCLKYPLIINCLFNFYNITIIEVERCKNEKNNKKVILLNKMSELYIKIFEDIISLFRLNYTNENGNLKLLINEYLKILDIYKSDIKKYDYLFVFIVSMLKNINFNNNDLNLRVYNIFKETQNVALIIPMIGYYDLNIIKELLPIIINKSDKNMIKECFKNIIRNPYVTKERTISSSDLLIILISYSYPDINVVDKKKTVDVIDCCFELTQSNPPIFESETIASVIGKFVQDDKSIFPRTLGRTLVLSVLYLPTVRSFISTFVISSLIRNCNVWEDTLTWRGVKHCIQKLWSDYKSSIFPNLILLPQSEFQNIFNELIETNSELRHECLDIIKKMVSSLLLFSSFTIITIFLKNFLEFKIGSSICTRCIKNLKIKTLFSSLVIPNRKYRTN